MMLLSEDEKSLWSLHMRRLALLLLATCIATTATAQPAPVPAPPTNPADAAATATGTPAAADTVKYIGFGGRKGTADQKTDALGKALPVADKAPPTNAQAAKPAMQPPVQVAAPAEPSKGLRSDKKIGGDASIAREKRAAEEKARQNAAIQAAIKQRTSAGNTASPSISGNPSGMSGFGNAGQMPTNPMMGMPNSAMPAGTGAPTTTKH
jgi:hypothetical protein